MKGKQLLFVTYHDETLDDGFSYAVELAKTMNDGIEILMILRRKALEKFEDLMTAITFAEADEPKTARELIREDYEKKNEDFDKRLAILKEECGTLGVLVDVSTAAGDVVSAIKNVLRQNTKIDMVLLSPSVTHDDNVNAKVLNRLVKTASRPIVTMAKQTHVA